MTYALDNVEPTTIDSADEIDTTRLEHGTLRLDKRPGVPSPIEWGLGLQETALSFDTGEYRVYRDTEGTGTIEVREADDHYLVRKVEPRAGERRSPTPDAESEGEPEPEPEGGSSRSVGRLLLLVLVLAVAAAVAHRVRRG